MSDVLTKEELAARQALHYTRAFPEDDEVLACVKRLASEVERLRRELAELRKPVETLPTEIESELDRMERFVVAVDEQSSLPLGWRTGDPLPESEKFSALRSAILKALNERGGGA
jgi:hypothetical protein